MPQSLQRNEDVRVAKLKPVVKNIPPSLLVATIQSISKEESRAGVKDDDTLFGQVFASKPFDDKRRECIGNVIKKISATWDGEMEAEIKLVTNCSDINLEFMRNYRHKSCHEVTNSYTMKTVEDGIDFR